MLQDLDQIREANPNPKVHRVQYYWQYIENDNLKWREWITHPNTYMDPLQKNTQALTKELAKRKIQVRTGPNILRWGYRPRGTCYTHNNSPFSLAI